MTNKDFRCALDIDGCLADFNTGFIQAAQERGWTDYFPTHWTEIKTWYYAPQHMIDAVFADIRTDLAFWTNLPLCDDLELPLPFVPVAYVTNRYVESWVTALWLEYVGLPKAEVFTVATPEEKLEVLQQLDVDCFVDDRAETVEYLNDNGIYTYCYDRGWNQGLDAKYPRIKSLKELVDVERDGQAAKA